MDGFLRSQPPGSEEARHLFVTTYKPTAAAADRQRKSVVAPRPEATAAGGDGRKRARRGTNGLSTSNPKGISSSARVKEFPNEALEVSAGRLFCGACSTRLGTRKSTIMSHCGITKTGAHVPKPNNHMKKMVLFNANKTETPQRMARFTDFCERKTGYGMNLHPEVNDRRCKVRPFFLFFFHFSVYGYTGYGVRGTGINEYM